MLRAWNERHVQSDHQCTVYNLVNGNSRTTPHIAHFFPVGMTVKAEVSVAVKAHDLVFVVDENNERNVVYTDNKYVSKQVRLSNGSNFDGM